MNIGRRIYYDKVTGDVLADTGERAGDVIELTIEQDIANYKALSERTRDSFDLIELSYGEFSQDFRECNGYRVDPTNKEMVFSYPDPSDPEPEVPVFQVPLSEQVKLLKAQNAAITERADFIEDIIAEMAMQVYT